MDYIILECLEISWEHMGFNSDFIGLQLAAWGFSTGFYGGNNPIDLMRFELQIVGRGFSVGYSLLIFDGYY